MTHHLALSILDPASLITSFGLVGVYAIIFVECALIIGFFFSTLSTYLRFKDLEVRYARLARAVALERAQPPE